MPRFALVLATTLGASLTAAAQSAPVAPAPQSTVSPGAVTLTTGTQLVVVDVTVLDRSGQPVRGLKASDFLLEESRKPQVVRHFDEHSGVVPAPATSPKLPPMPPGTFTDYEPVPPSTTLNVLLLDALNTPMTDQSYVRYQLQQYVKHAQPGTRIAIFGLGQRLSLLQGFSSDPEILKAAVEHKLLPRASVVLDDPVGTGVIPTNLSDSVSDAGGSASVVASLQQFEAQTATFQAQLRTRYTIDAFEDLGRYLAQFPGRKNLIWFSGSFPLAIFPDPTLEDPFAAQLDSSGDLREASNLLSRARVAVYPVDARGLQTDPTFSAARSGRGGGAAALASSTKFSQANAEEHMTMEQVAEDTGGHAFYNTNDLAAAVTKAITAGSNFYTLTYSPSEHKTNGEYRNIKVQLQGTPVALGAKLTYRHGYYADNVKEKLAGASSSILPATTAAAANVEASQPTYRSSSMQRGAPTLSEVLFKVRVLPASLQTEETIAPGNLTNPNAPMKGPFRRYLIDFAAIGRDFKLDAMPDGRRRGAAQFLTYVYSADGKLLNTGISTVQLNLEAPVYAEMLKTGLHFHEEISVPAKGESFLRLGIHDVRSGHMGAIEVPASSIARLAPPPPPAPATPPPAALPAVAPPK